MTAPRRHGAHRVHLTSNRSLGNGLVEGMEEEPTEPEPAQPTPQSQQGQQGQQAEDSQPAVTQPDPEDEKYREWRGEWAQYERECAEAGVHPVHGEGYEDLAGELEDLIASDGLSGDSLADACEELDRLEAAEDAADRVLDCMEGLARRLSMRREGAGTGGVDGTDRSDQSDYADSPDFSDSPDYPGGPVNTESAVDMDTGDTGDAENTGDMDDAEKPPFIATEDYEDWRFGMEEAVMSAREILGDDVLYGPHVTALGGREDLEADLAAAREILGNDDLVLDGYTAAARADQWEAEWVEYVDRAAGDGLDPRRTEAGLEMIAQGRTITGDPSLPRTAWTESRR